MTQKEFRRLAAAAIKAETDFRNARSLIAAVTPDLIDALMERISLREIARRAGLSSTYVSFLRTKRAKATLENYLKLVDLLATVD